MLYIEAPNIHLEDEQPSLFLGGGITNCKDWHYTLVSEVKDFNVTIYNPRRKKFDMDDITQSEIQIKWEFKHMNKADVLVFYFSEETLCPITLFEFGSRMNSCIYRKLHGLKKQSILIYCEPGYKRKSDVEIQFNLLKIDLHEKINKCKSELITPEYFDAHYFSEYNIFVEHLKNKLLSL